MPTVLCWLGALALAAAGCGQGDKGVQPEGEQSKSAALVGFWFTRGDEPDLGAQVDVLLELQAAGRLRVTVTQPGGASLSFPGTWALTDESLLLRGVWFKPDGEVEVACEVRGTALILTAADGSAQTWERQP